jgi:hypothetical protein
VKEMSEIRLSTAGITFNYAVETTAGTRPTSGYIEIPEVTEIPEMNTTPGTIDVTPLSATRTRIYINDLMDLGGALSYTANFSQEELDMWNNTIVPAYEKAIESGKNMWFCIIIPGFNDAFYYTGVPSKIGMPGAAVGNAFQVALPVTPSNEPDWYAKPTSVTKTST